jgi:hypothetical protein
MRERLSLDNDYPPLHRRVDAANIIVGARLVEDLLEGSALVDVGRDPRSVGGLDRMGGAVLVRPADRAAHRHGDLSRGKGEVLDRHIGDPDGRRQNRRIFELEGRRGRGHAPARGVFDRRARG